MALGLCVRECNENGWLAGGFYRISSGGRTCFGTVVKFVVLNIEHGADQFGFVSGVCEYMRKVWSDLQEDIAYKESRRKHIIGDNK